MAQQSGISWTDATHNEWVGCTKVSPACDNCYAEALMDKRMGKAKWGAGQQRVLTSEANRNLPHRWNRIGYLACAGCNWRGEVKDWQKNKGCPSCDRGEFVSARRRVFSSSLSDWLDNEVPIEWLVGLLDTIRQTPKLDWLLLTKRIGNWRKRLGEALNASNCIYLREWIALWLAGDAPPHVWIGGTMEWQPVLDRDMDKLLDVPAAVRFISAEPMVGEMDLSRWLDLRRKPHGWESSQHASGRYIEWVICGGESGPNARPMHPEWAASLRDQCIAAGVPFHFKQWGEWGPMHGSLTAPGAQVLGHPLKGDTRILVDLGSPYGGVARYGKKEAGRELDGREWNEFPRSAA